MDGEFSATTRKRIAEAQHVNASDDRYTDDKSGRTVEVAELVDAARGERESVDATKVRRSLNDSAAKNVHSGVATQCRTLANRAAGFALAVLVGRNHAQPVTNVVLLKVLLREVLDVPVFRQNSSEKRGNFRRLPSSRRDGCTHLHVKLGVRA